jgi:D-glycero-alpha-D-manno-heptose 1-phosphate guanylyltransferase
VSASPLANVVAVLLAGGLGTRVRHLLPELPKPMAPVAGRPFLEWVVRFLAKQGVRRVVISTGYRAEVVSQHFQTHPVSGVSLQCIAEPQPLGTAGGCGHAVRASGQTPAAWLVLNGDSLVFADLGELAQRLDASKADGAILGLAVPDAARFGSLAVDPEGQLLRFAEKTSGSGIVNAGVYLLSAAAVDRLPENRPSSFEKDVFPAWLAKGYPIQVVVTKAPFLDIGTEESLAQAEGFVQTHQPQFWQEPR